MKGCFLVYQGLPYEVMVEKTATSLRASTEPVKRLLSALSRSCILRRRHDYSRDLNRL